MFVSLFVLVAIALAYSYLDTMSTEAAETSTVAALPSTTRAATGTTSTTIPPANRLCGLAQRTAPQTEGKSDADAAKVMLAFYTEAASFTEGELHADLAAAERYYKTLVEIGSKGNWDVRQIVKNKQGDRWRQLVTAPPPGVDGARSSVQQICRIRLIPPPLVAVNADGLIADPALRALLEPKDIELPPWSLPPTTAAGSSPSTSRTTATTR